MKTPKDMRIIQIDITNACIHQCSNCTRFCGHHKKPFFMSFETFKRAVDSLEGYVGTVGIMGGEPTLHPEFERFVEYIASRYPEKTDNKLLRPQLNFMDAIHDLEFEHTCGYDSGCGKRATVAGPGLWTAIGDGYKKYYETVQDHILYQAVNDHSNAMYHQPALITRKELGIGDDEWLKLRDNCWIQNLWSATVTPKGAFFCEIAGALDMLFDGPGGIPIEPGWWMKRPEEFGDQLDWCEMCGIALNTFTRDANEETDDVSPLMYEKLKALGSPKVKAGRVNVVRIRDGKIDEESMASGKKQEGSLRYTDGYNARFDAKKTNLTYKEYAGIFLCNTRKEADVCLGNAKLMKRSDILAAPEIYDEVKGLASADNNVFVYRSGERRLGYLLYEMARKQDYNLYICITEGKIRLEEEMLISLGGMVLNPGTMLYGEGEQTAGMGEQTVSGGEQTVSGGEQTVSGGEQTAGTGAYWSGSGKAALINGIAKSLQAAGWDRLLQIEDIAQLKGLWMEDKILPLSPESGRMAPSSAIEAGKRYVVYGAGDYGHSGVRIIRENGASVAAVVDSDKEKWGSHVEDIEVISPQFLTANRTEFDRVLIGSVFYYPEIKEYLLGLGFKESELSLL